MKHGCCADKACNGKTCMALPEGKTCGDCVNFRRCSAFVGSNPTDTSCDWFPRRFNERPASDADASTPHGASTTDGEAAPASNASDQPQAGSLQNAEGSCASNGGSETALAAAAWEAVHALTTVHYNHMGETFADVDQCWQAAKTLHDLLTLAPTATTPQEPSRGMTDEEIAEIAERCEATDPTDSFWRTFARAVESHIVGGERDAERRLLPDGEQLDGEVRQSMGEALTTTLLDGAESPDWNDGREVDRIIDCVQGVLAMHLERWKEDADKGGAQ